MNAADGVDVALGAGELDCDGVGGAAPDGLTAGEVCGVVVGAACSWIWVGCCDGATGGDTSTWDVTGSGAGGDAAGPIRTVCLTWSVIAQVAVPLAGWTGVTVIVIVPEPDRLIGTKAARWV